MSPLFLAIDYVSERAAIKTVERKSRERKTRRMKCHEKKIAKKIECRSFVFLWICPFSFLWCGVGATFVGAVLAISTVCAPTDAIAFYSNDFLSTWSWQETRLAFTLFNDPQVQPLRFLTAPFSCKPWLLQFIRLQRRVQVCRFLKQEHLDFSDSMQDAVSVSPRDLDINPQQQPFFLFCLFDTIWLPISDKKKICENIFIWDIYIQELHPLNLHSVDILDVITCLTTCFLFYVLLIYFSLFVEPYFFSLSIPAIGHASVANTSLLQPIMMQLVCK